MLYSCDSLTSFRGSPVHLWVWRHVHHRLLLLARPGLRSGALRCRGALVAVCAAGGASQRPRVSQPPSCRARKARLANTAARNAAAEGPRTSGLVR
jgi:hypothetical protein